MPSCRVRSTTVFGGGGCSLPLGCGTAAPGSYTSPPACRPRDGYFGEMMLVVISVSLAHGGGRLVWWLRGSSSRGSWVIDRPGLWKGFREKSLSVCSTPTRCRLRGGIFLPEGRRGYLSSASLGAGGNTRTSVLVRAVAWLSFLKVLLGTRRFGARSVVVLLRRGRSGCGSPSLSRSAYVSILFLFFSSPCFGCMFAAAPAFRDCWLYRVVAIFI